MRGVQQPGAESGIFVWRGQVAKLSYIHTHTHFFIIYTLFYFISYIYKHTQQQKRTSHFQSKLYLMLIFRKIKFIFTIFIMKFLKSFIFDTFYQILY